VVAAGATVTEIGVRARTASRVGNIKAKGKSKKAKMVVGAEASHSTFAFLLWNEEKRLTVLFDASGFCLFPFYFLLFFTSSPPG